MSEEVQGRIITLFPQKFPPSRLFRIKSRDGATFTCKGNVVHDLFEGMKIKLSGKFQQQGSYLNFCFDNYELEGEMFDVDGLMLFVMSTFRSIGKTRCEQVFKVFDNDTKKIYVALKDIDFKEILKSDVGTLIKNVFNEIRRIRKDSIDGKVLFQDTNLQDFEKRYQVTLLARALGFSKEQSQMFYLFYGEKFAGLVKEDVYKIVLDFPEIDFRAVDLVAKKIGQIKSPSRIKAIVLYALQSNSEQGSTCIELIELLRNLYEMARTHAIPEFVFEGKQITDAITQLKQDGLVITFGSKVYIKKIFELEKSVAEKLSWLSQAKVDLTKQMFDFVDRFEKLREVKFSDEQKIALSLAAKNSVTLISGLPGTGKTLLLEFFDKFYKMQGESVLIVAPTGIAAKGISQRTGADAGTIHRKLKYTQDGFLHNAMNPYPADVVLIDETSMIDLKVLDGLLDAIKQGVKVIFFGDEEQLPSVDIGICFKDMIDSGKLAHIKLIKIFRQQEVSNIIKLAHAIHAGKRMDLKGLSDITVIEAKDEKVVLNKLIAAITQMEKEKIEFKVLAPEKRKNIGVWNLNKIASDVINPKKESFSFGRVRLKNGDRIIVLQNRYEEPVVYNGDIGTITSLTEDQIDVTTDDGDEVSFTREEAMSGIVDLGYVVTVHKSQGLEFDVIVLLVHEDYDWKLMFKNLMYTAITRAKKYLLIIGQEEQFWKACRTERNDKRITGLKKMIIDKFDQIVH